MKEWINKQVKYNVDETFLSDCGKGHGSGFDQGVSHQAMTKGYVHEREVQWTLLSSLLEL